MLSAYKWVFVIGKKRANHQHHECEALCEKALYDALTRGAVTHSYTRIYKHIHTAGKQDETVSKMRGEGGAARLFPVSEEEHWTRDNVMANHLQPCHMTPRSWLSHQLSALLSLSDKPPSEGLCKHIFFPPRLLSSFLPSSLLFVSNTSSLISVSIECQRHSSKMLFVPH